jgi:hypothetical protein
MTLKFEIIIYHLVAARIIYTRHGKLHRDYRPAMSWYDGTTHWYQYGLCHRDDGPASTYKDGAKYWYIRGIKQ